MISWYWQTPKYRRLSHFFGENIIVGARPVWQDHFFHQNYDIFQPFGNLLLLVQYDSKRNASVLLQVPAARCSKRKSGDMIEISSIYSYLVPANEWTFFICSMVIQNLDKGSTRFWCWVVRDFRRRCVLHDILHFIECHDKHRFYSVLDRLGRELPSRYRIIDQITYISKYIDVNKTLGSL